MSNHHSRPHRPTVLVLHAHPDDEAIFTGLTIRGLADAGARVVLVTATSGEEGVPRVPLRPGEGMRERRVAELERAGEILGVARLELLGYRDSGAHRGPYERGTLGAATVSRLTRRVAAIVEQERPDAVVHYDPRGIYGHVDHVQVHRVGAAVAAWSGATSYEATVDAQALRRSGAAGGRHVLQQAAGEVIDAGVPLDDITFSVDEGRTTLAAKLAAMRAHASQIGPEYLASPAAYAREWFVRRGGNPVLESLLGTAIRSPLGAVTGPAPRAVAVAR